MSFEEIIVDTIEPKGDNIMYLLPTKLSSSKFLRHNTFDQATIKNTSVEKITSSGLIGILASLKPQGKITIFVHQPIAVMLSYDAKQIEANLKLAGFENIQISDTNIKDEKTGKIIQTQSVEASKPLSKRSGNVNIEIRRSRYEDIKPYKRSEKREIREEPVNNRYNVTTSTKTTVIETSNTYKPRNKTYMRQELKEDLPIEEKKSFSRRRFGQNTEEIRPKNRTYVREEKTEGTGNLGYYKRKYRFTSSKNEN